MSTRRRVRHVCIAAIVGACGPRASPVDVGHTPAPPDAGTVVATDAASAEQGAPTPSYDPASGNVGTWREVNAPPAKTAGVLSQREEKAPGRSDSAGQINGYCPPRALVFKIDDARSLVTREPCSGLTEISIRSNGVEKRVADSMLYGVTGKWSVVPMSKTRVLMISVGTVTNVQLVDLSTARARWVRLPVGFDRAHDLHVGVANGEVFLWGGTLEQAVGSTGCGSPTPGMGCDPVPVLKYVPNKAIWALLPD
jgi:hypothetical protein